MHSPSPLAQPTDIVYIYDGSIAGFYCAIFECVYSRELPFAIYTELNTAPTLFMRKRILTQEDKAQRVRDSITKKMCRRALELIEIVFFSCLEQKELCMLNFMLLGYEKGSDVVNMLSHPHVSPLLKAEKHLFSEAHLLKGFIRFTDDDGMLVATITPKNYILPFIAGHFMDRYANERFMIYDKTHNDALVYQQGRIEIMHLEGVEFGAISQEEADFRALWKQFYSTIGIQGRTNPKCRMSHMPKRYWENMLEVQDLL